VFAEPLADPDAVSSRQHQVQEHHVEAVAQRLLEPAIAVALHRDDDPVPFEILPGQGRESRNVLNQQ
jgi:hypothetical protein